MSRGAEPRTRFHGFFPLQDFVDGKMDPGAAVAAGNVRSDSGTHISRLPYRSARGAEVIARRIDRPGRVREPQSPGGPGVTESHDDERAVVGLQRRAQVHPEDPSARRRAVALAAATRVPRSRGLSLHRWRAVRRVPSGRKRRSEGARRLPAGHQQTRVHQGTKSALVIGIRRLRKIH
jgi:hypothetical protein